MFFRCLLVIILILPTLSSGASGKNRLVIASQQGSSALASNTLPALVYAITSGADLVEYQLVMTRDDQLIALNTLFLDEKTNAATIFPDRAREDGKYYVIDFTLQEIQQLSLTEPGLDSSPEYHIPSFLDVLMLHGHLEKNLGRKVGLYLEVKSPWFHHKEGKDISDSTLKLLKQYGFTGEEERVVYLQCYDPEELQRIHEQLLPVIGMKLKLVQLMETNKGVETKRKEAKSWVSYDYGWLLTKMGLKVISSYADALGLEKDQLISPKGEPLLRDYTQAAKALGIQIHARGIKNPDLNDSEQKSFSEILEHIFVQIDAEAIVTNDWIKAAAFINNKKHNAVETTANHATEAEESPLNPVDLTPTHAGETRETATQF